MLISFTADNIYSFAEQVKLDMEATAIRAHNYSLLDTGKKQLLPVAALYGANASGKSNLLRALHLLLERMTGESDIRAIPWLMDGRENAPLSNLRLEIAMQKYQFVYSLGMILDDVYGEALLYTKAGQTEYQKVFSRVWEDEQWSLTLGECAFAKKLSEEIRYVHAMEKKQDNLLMCNLGKRGSTPEFEAMYHWASKAVTYSHEEAPDTGVPYFPKNSDIDIMLNNEYMKQSALKFVRSINPTIRDITSEPLTASNNKGDAFTMGFQYEVSKMAASLFSSTDLVLSNFESRGVYNAVLLYPTLYNVLQNGGLLIVDELERSLHPLLMAEIINMFTDPDTNPGKGQLVFSTHNALLMDKKYFRQDEIVFVEKDDEGKSSAYRLSDIEGVRSDLDFCKHYILGAFGAIPDFSHDEGDGGE